MLLKSFYKALKNWSYLSILIHQTTWIASHSHFTHLSCASFTQSNHLLPLSLWRMEKKQQILHFLQREKDVSHSFIQLCLQPGLLKISVSFGRLWFRFKENMRFNVTFKIKPVKYWHGASKSIQHHGLRPVEGLWSGYVLCSECFIWICPSLCSL